MARLKRSSAGRRVSDLVTSLSDSLVEDEDRCKEAMDAVFAEGVSAVFDALAGADRRGVPLGDPDVVAHLEELARKAVAGAADEFRALCVVAVDKALTSVQAELQHCEDTVSPRYRGTAAEAVQAVRNVEDQIGALGETMFLSSANRCLTWFRHETAREMAGSETLDEAVERMVAPAPVQWPGHSGRGLWWQIVLWLHQITRETEFACVNSARSEAMRVMNQIGEERDHAARV